MRSNAFDIGSGGFMIAVKSNFLKLRADPKAFERLETLARFDFSFSFSLLDCKRADGHSRLILADASFSPSYSIISEEQTHRAAILFSIPTFLPSQLSPHSSRIRRLPTVTSNKLKYSSRGTRSLALQPRSSCFRRVVSASKMT
jgi:hypothetical protein